MNLGIDIIFFKPSEPESIKEGRLFIDVDGKNYIDYVADSWLEIYDPIHVYYATGIHTKEEYTIVNGVIIKTEYNIYRFEIEELYQGAFLANVLEENILHLGASFSGLTSWLNQPSFELKSFPQVDKIGQIYIHPEFETNYYIKPGILLTLNTYCGQSLSRNQIILNNYSYIRLIADPCKSRLEIFQIFQAFMRFISLFTTNITQLFHLSFSLSSGKDIKLITNKENRKTDTNQAILTFSYLNLYLDNALKLYFQNQSQFVRVIDLINESRQNHTPEISFLNITTAFEVFHQNFFQTNNNDIRIDLTNRLIQKKVIKQDNGEWQQIVRYFHYFLIANDIEEIQKSFPDIDKIIVLIRDSRNHYTHFPNKAKSIWTPKQLIPINRDLVKLLKVAILKKLELPNDLVNKCIKSTGQYIERNYEQNEYSVNFLERKVQNP
jgi:hypothetical protein